MPAALVTAPAGVGIRPLSLRAGARPGWRASRRRRAATCWIDFAQGQWREALEATLARCRNAPD
ncbi:MAG: hypothetical protein ACK5QW_09910 [Cyanobacteriota bacterium]